MASPATIALLVALSQDPLPPLTFAGFRAGMPLAQATAVVKASQGHLRCRSSSDRRIGECTGSLSVPGVARPMGVLISSIHDSAAVIVVSGAPSADLAKSWIEELTRSFGRPDHTVAPVSQHTWQWVRRSRMLRVIARTAGDSLETAVTLTHGPLLDGLGRPPKKKPD